MADVSSHHQTETPHSAHRMTTRSSDGTLIRHPDDHHQHQQQQSPSVASLSRLNRKRAASINVQEANRARVQGLSLHTPLDHDHSSSLIPHDVCICPPSPKVPRPRNGELRLCVSFRFGARRTSLPLASMYRDEVANSCPFVSAIVGALGISKLIAACVSLSSLHSVSATSASSRCTTKSRSTQS